MVTEERIILIGNYLPDKQESMIRFAFLLNSGFLNAGVSSEIWWPTRLFGSKAKVTNSGTGKWLGYFDKYIVFPLVLSWRVRKRKFNNTRFHVCDHSNAPYLKYLPANRSSITCHDVIAIRGGLGYSDSYQPASKLGRFLQNWILHHLKKARSIAFVSQLSLNQFKDLVEDEVLEQKNWRVIHNSFNADFNPMDRTKAKEILSKEKINLEVPFLLHVGSDLPRKNRKLLLDMVAILRQEQKINLCLAGEGMNNGLLAYARALNLQNNLLQVVKPNHQTLVALYTLCDAFIFPSLSEGFGWPLIEAQACGAPVIASNVEPMPEVSGGAALHFDPTQAKDFAKGYQDLQNQNLREELIKKGFENCSRFHKKQMVSAYLNLYN